LLDKQKKNLNRKAGYIFAAFLKENKLSRYLQTSSDQVVGFLQLIIRIFLVKQACELFILSTSKC